METFKSETQTFEQSIQNWINSKGDLDDFIFYYEENHQNEPENQYGK
ncbi:MAG: hypothetical protein RSA99_00855 [Oscillospiraceae bacterium]